MNNNEQEPRPPEVDTTKLDFSQFHATGDHWPFSKYCRSQYGGGRLHLRYAWQFRYGPDLRAATTCRLGLLHRYVNSWGGRAQGTPYLGKRCRYCGRKKRDQT